MTPRLAKFQPSRPFRPPVRLRRPGAARARRGSTFIIVLSLLSLLALVATALSLTTRLEVISAANYADGVQARMAAKTGLSATSSRLAAYAQPAAVAQEASGGATASSAGSTLSLTDLLVIQPTHSFSLSLADVALSDASARVNINTADEDTLRRLLRNISLRSGVADGDPSALARSIVARRNQDARRLRETQSVQNRATAETSPEKSAASTTSAGADANSGKTSWPAVSVVSYLAWMPEDPNRADLRLPPLQDEKRFSSLVELLDLPGASPALISAAAPYLTTFSACEDYADLPETGRRALTDLNTATVTEIYEALQALYPGERKRDALLRQFAVNLADWRDPDSIPTPFPVAPGEPAILGLERIPFISEVWPNSIDPEEANGAGQYVELYNPWSTALSVEGWTLHAAGGPVTLQGRIVPGGYLVITDNRDGVRPDTARDTPFDSFYSIFNQVGNSTSKRLAEAPALRLAWSAGAHTVTLRDAQGNLMDEFTYTVKTPLTSQKTSYQRADPRLRVAAALRCTPLAPHPYREYPVEDAELAEFNPPNRPFLRRAEVLKVFAAWSGTERPGDPETLLYPILATPFSPDAESSVKALSPLLLDARLLDAFTVDAAALRRIFLEGGVETSSSTAAAGSTPGAGLTASSAAATEASRLIAQVGEEIESPVEREEYKKAVSSRNITQVAALAARAALSASGEAPVRLGAVNLNTAPEEILAALPGLDAKLAAAWNRRRVALGAQNAQRRLGDSGAVALFRRPSDLLADADFWQAAPAPEERYRRLTDLLDVAGFNTRAVFIESRTAVERKASASGSRQPSISRARALVAFDRGAPEFVAWSDNP